MRTSVVVAPKSKPRKLSASDNGWTTDPRSFESDMEAKLGVKLKQVSLTQEQLRRRATQLIAEMRETLSSMR